MRKFQGFNRTAIAIAVSTIFLLSACAGGGGGGGGANNPGTPSAGIPSSGPSLPTPSGGGGGGGASTTPLSYGTPVKVATIDPLVNVAGTGYKWAVADTFTADITGNGQDLIIAGRMTQPTTSGDWGPNRISMLSWENGTMVDKTAQWFPDNSNIILGTEPSVKFADFFKSGKTDMFVAPSTDSTNYGPAYVFTNTGSRFNRQSIDIGNVWSHDSAIADLDGDTFKDIIVTDYGPKTTMIINDQVSSFIPMYDRRGSAGDLKYGGSGIAVADFLQNGRNQLIITDNTCGTSNPSCGSSTTKMYTWTVDKVNRDVTYTYHSDLPGSRFNLPKWASHGFAGSHAVRAAAFDFNDDRIPDTIIFSMPVAGPTTTSTKYSEIQFLANNGTGRFTDVTDTTLVGYNTNTYTTYNPKFIDLNGDGRTDILVSGHDYTGKNDSVQFLLKSSDGKYVAAYQNILTNFATDANKLQNTENSGNTVNMVKGPDGKLYLVTASSFINSSGDRNLAIYMSPLGSQSTMTAKIATDLIKTAWPYMTEQQVANTLRTTSLSLTTSAGTGYLINPDAILSPYGSLGFNSQKGMLPISGFLSGVNIGDGKAIAMDSLGRSFNLNISQMTNANAPNAFMMNTAHIDEHQLSSHAEYLVGGPVYNLDGIRVGADQKSTFANDTQLLGRNPGQIPQQYTVGVPNVYQNGKVSFGVQYTSLNSSPWLAMGGAWGQINNTGILDHVMTYRDGGFSVQNGLMYTSTNITPGLVINITPITSAWSEAGYRFTRDGFGDIGFYAGVKPYVLSGSVEANIPTAVDNQGNTVYSKRNLAVQNPVTSYARVLYTNRIDKKTMYRFSAMATQTGQYRFMHELRFWID